MVIIMEEHIKVTNILYQLSYVEYLYYSRSSLVLVNTFLITLEKLYKEIAFHVEIDRLFFGGTVRNVVELVAIIAYR